MKRILVIRGAAIGDFILTLPAIRLLRENFPQARIELLGYKHILEIAENRFYAEAIRSIEYAPFAGFFAKDTELSTELCGYFRSFDLVVNYLFDPDRIFEQNLVRAGVDNFLACSPKIGGLDHAAKQLARPLEQLGLSLGDHAAHLYPSLGDRETAEEFLRVISAPIIALHPGSGSKPKNWPIAHWRQLAESLTDVSLLIVGGEADDAEVEALSSVSVHRAHNLSLPLLAAILQKCALFLGHDSGISHLAAAVGTRCVLLFGPTNPEIWAPANENVVILRAPSGVLRDIEIEEVRRALLAGGDESA